MTDEVRIPVIKLHDTLIVSIQIAMSDHVAQQLKNDLTERIEQTRATGLVIDVSGIDVMDSYLSRVLRDMGLIGKLMGVRTVISGMAPMIAMTLVEMGLELKGVTTSLNLEAALETLKADEASASTEQP